MCESLDKQGLQPKCRQIVASLPLGPIGNLTLGKTLMNIQSKVSDKAPPLTTVSPENLSQLISICLAHLNDAIVITEAEPIESPGPRIIWANKVFFDRNGYTAEEIIGESPRILQGPLTDRATLDKIRHALKKWQSIRAETLNYRKDGSTYWNEFEIVPVANEVGWFTHWVSVQRDITDRKLMEIKFKELASIDFLTGVLYRRNFMAKMEDEIARLQRGIQANVAVLMLDLDLFKQVNDTYGHAAGDAVLQHFSSLLRNSLRKVDTVGRLGGEEFAILLPDTNTDSAMTFAERIRLTVMNTPAEFKDQLLAYTVSIGISILVETNVSADDVLIRADNALYRAKGEGRNRVVMG